MSHFPDLPAGAVDFVVGILVRLILPTLGDDPAAARALARDMLAEYQPGTLKELRLAAEIIGLSLNALNALADAAQPDALQPDAALHDAAQSGPRPTRRSAGAPGRNPPLGQHLCPLRPCGAAAA